MHLGSFALVLHAHVPYVRHTGQSTCGEEILCEAMAESYIPLLNAINDLKSDGIEPRLTLGLDPILLEQLADAEINKHFELYLQERIALAEADTTHPDVGPLARWYRDWYASLLTDYRERYARNLIGTFKALFDAGNLDILTSAATHGYLPLFERDSTIYAQLKLGIETTRKYFGHAPRGVWLPECGYRPAYMIGNQYKAGIEEFLADLNLGYFITDTQAIIGSKSLGLASPDVPARKIVVRADDRPEAKQRTTMNPYFVQAANVAAFGCDQRTVMAISGVGHNYPSDFVYREPHRIDPRSGLKYWRTTAPNVALDQKEHYDPAAAFKRVHMHAEHFVDLVTQEIRTYHYQGNTTGIVVAAYNTETFGRGWFEGIDWLKQVLRLIAQSDDVELTTASAYLEQHPPQNIIALPESSWGKKNDHSTWLNSETTQMWDDIHSAEREMESLVTQFPNADGNLLVTLNQAARELLLLESSDWESWMSTSKKKVFASERFRQHLARFNRLATIARHDAIDNDDLRLLTSIAEIDNPFAVLDYRLFAARE